MKVLKSYDINDTFEEAILLMQKEGVERPSRNGPVLEYPEPVSTVYLDPRKRVLFSSARDANPFFHLFESLWMMNGGKDGRSLNYFISDFTQRYSDDGVNIRGSAYGHRWRSWFHEDQLSRVVDRLKKDVDNRRQVLSMWDPYTDNAAADAGSKDVPCNLIMHPYIRDGKLHLTVFNRSNDIIWGCYGGNAVHFSLILEYLANKIGVPVGTYTQVSDSWHAYTDLSPVWERVKYSDPNAPFVKNYEHLIFADGSSEVVPVMNYEYFNPTYLGAGQEGWDAVLDQFCQFFASQARERKLHYTSEMDRFSTVVKAGQHIQFWRAVAGPMFASWVAWKSSKRASIALGVLDKEMDSADSDPHNDWLNAATMWLKRRVK